MRRIKLFEIQTDNLTKKWGQVLSNNKERNCQLVDFFTDTFNIKVNKHMKNIWIFSVSKNFLKELEYEGDGDASCGPIPWSDPQMPGKNLE